MMVSCETGAMGGIAQQLSAKNDNETVIAP